MDTSKRVTYRFDLSIVPVVDHELRVRFSQGKDNLFRKPGEFVTEMELLASSFTMSLLDSLDMAEWCHLLPLSDIGGSLFCFGYAMYPPPHFLGPGSAATGTAIRHWGIFGDSGLSNLDKIRFSRTRHHVHVIVSRFRLRILTRPPPLPVFPRHLPRKPHIPSFNMAPSIVLDPISSETTHTKIPQTSNGAAESQKTILKAPLPNPSLQVTADHNLKQVEAPVYAPGHGDVLLHIKATGVCG